MHVSHLSLTDFRSYTQLDVDLGPGPSAFVGPNGQGKTNLVEAIAYASALSSHRVTSEAALVRAGAPRAVVRVRATRGDRQTLVELEINPGRANRAQVNRAPVRRPRDVLGILRTVVFAPEDLALVKGDPEGRRRFLDDLTVQVAPRMAGVLADYDRVLRQRGALLKSAGPGLRRHARVPAAPAAAVGDGSPDAGRPDSGGDLRTLDVWDAKLAQTGAQVLAARIRLVEQLRPPVVQAYAQVSDGGVASLRYSSSLLGTVPDAGGGSLGDEVPESGSPRADGVGVIGDPDTALGGPAVEASLAVSRVGVGDAAVGLAPADGSGPDVASLEAEMLDTMRRQRRQELERGVNLVGPHRDDLVLGLGDLPARGYASHGESWSFALALRLAAYHLLTHGADQVDGIAGWSEGSQPVLILDDVFAELDAERRSRLAQLVGGAEQVLVTAAVAQDVPTELLGARYDVMDGRVTRAH